MIFDSLDELARAAGTELGVSDWLVVDQQRIDRFADATDDHQWIHVDPERAATAQFGRTVAHGFLTLALIAPMTQQVMGVDGVSMVINYGLDRVRFITPVTVGSRVRARVELTTAQAVPGGLQVTRTVTVEVEGAPKPACVAESLLRYVR
ncbi:MaoC family dehydratase [Saccharopolyspora spinosa]|uniref:Acyl dehydratase n=1 Tax=Saccharopolyspora spinosa TaxID=60894 RepID=A0A2N3Y1R0_SACSN|nr:MaoC family dehydratase [Saccharopolyspora spinosa]PKW16839.1 acyl dehydratase [Saccharopolyspora spinosa]